MATYAFSDLHGNYNLWKQIQEYLEDNDKAFCLGDCNDRGPDGVKIIQEVLADNRITYLCGNHEAMLLDYSSSTPWDSYDYHIIEHNGMKQTLHDFQILPDEEYYLLKDKLRNLPTSYIYNNKDNKKIFLSHAGCDPWDINTRTDKDLIWDRNHLYTKNFNPVQLDGAHEIIVHGHTPVQYLKEDVLGLSDNSVEVVNYCDGIKYDIDMGSFISNKVALLNLDTFEIKYFIDNNKNL